MLALAAENLLGTLAPARKVHAADVVARQQNAFRSTALLSRQESVPGVPVLLELPFRGVTRVGEHAEMFPDDLLAEVGDDGEVGAHGPAVGPGEWCFIFV